MKIINIAKYCK